jgi:hypothetical protein
MPTVTKSVAANGDDGYISGGGINLSLTVCRAGRDSGGLDVGTFLRFTGVTLSGTITTSYLTVYETAVGTASPFLKIRAVDEDNPAAPTNYNEYIADPLTTAGVDWDATWTTAASMQSPSLNTILQELVDSYTIDNDAIILRIDDDGSVANRRGAFASFESVTADPPMLYIEYTEAGVSKSAYYLLQQ